MTTDATPLRRPDSGSGMDTRLPTRPWARRWLLLIVLVAAGGITLAAAAWQALPTGVRTPATSLRIATVQRGVYENRLGLRGSAQALNSVVLDADDSGRVEAVMVRDGEMVRVGQPLFRLSNSQRQIELLARQSDQATQIANLANLQVNLEASVIARDRRLIELRFQLAQVKKRHARNQELAGMGYLSAAALEASADELETAEHLLRQEAAIEAELDIRRRAVAQMQSANDRLSSGLRLLSATVEALLVRAPVAGRLADFRLNVGESVQRGQNIGHIDDPASFKLTAKVNEFYLNAVATGQQGTAHVNGVAHAVEVSRIYPQIKDGQFDVELLLRQQPRHLSPGQSIDVDLNLGASTPALLLPNGTYVNESQGAGMLVLDRDGRTAVRRQVRVGRRSATQIEILDGVQEGDRVIVSSYADFRDAHRLSLTE
ncbi:efflux RND transporter periplasmic adaptor subunit [Roseateles amylovorans]|uniref:Efflux RND transporter periplasmic adaptor subunit n=1 Tax=Roseateles amylovorans TaxID=2978473 RepID=A0ABY6AWH2_9BURK|nr:efflux RND transporter periplasmic adaptor subunit [Roseateles amylovorans]UXH76114.1 efflux RND transporter periplasmic adaptor subunit [Roseateles amylovorans]